MARTAFLGSFDQSLVGAKSTALNRHQPNQNSTQASIGVFEHSSFLGVKSAARMGLCT